MHAADCGAVAQQAGVRHLILSHFYPIAERYDVKDQVGDMFLGRITLGRDLMRLSLGRD
jgi:ribonuclease BN (tRNA processing enzyme)